MTVTKPYRRTCRQLAGGSYTSSGNGRYITHPKYATSPEHYLRAYLILLKDLSELFDFVEPAESNLQTHSYRIHALLMRACIEVEANCKAILKENGYSKPGDWNMGDYKMIEKTHFLSGYVVHVENWSGAKSRKSAFRKLGYIRLAPVVSGLQPNKAR